MSLFTQPVDDDYLSQTTALYGDKLEIPEPFGFDLDTSELPRCVKR